MKAISLWQPWASLIAIGAKKIETRSWSTNYRGELLVHAAKKKPLLCELNMTILRALTEAGYHRLQQLPLGGFVAIARLLECISTNEFQPPEPERSFGDYSAGRFAWKLELVRPVQVMIPYPGSQGFFDVPNELLEEEF